MRICIPSYKRADNCLTAKMLSRATIFAHEFEADDYREHNENEVITIPDDISGKGMGVIRNYMIDHAGDEEIMMLDDDIRDIRYIERLKRVSMKEEQIYRFIDDGFRMCREAGTVMWGINIQDARMFYREYTPFSLNSVVLGTFMGLIKDDDLRFDEDLGLKEDFDYALQVLNKHRKIFRFNKYHFVADHITRGGGCASYRTQEKEIQQAEAFQRKWGSRIVKIKRRTTTSQNVTTSPLVKCPIKGI